jgi:hypothetical protein
LDDRNCFKNVTIATWIAPAESAVLDPSEIAMLRTDGTHPLMQSAKLLKSINNNNKRNEREILTIKVTLNCGKY